MNFVDNPKNKQILIKMDIILFRQLLRYCKNNNLTRSEMARRAIKKFIDENV